ncbi:MAG: tRNA lysidine(34) synthetase TilS [Treponema sp.]|jgi:tRNA(Ile)-lysidine synthase|nr:tRNA lysidine(34) synthetase TilS [Treponema sp.]
MNRFEAAVEAALGSLSGELLLAAVSGGADSTAMLAALAALRDRKGMFSLSCIHVEHGLRPARESRGDARAVKALCEKLAVPCKLVSVQPGKIARTAAEQGLGIEAAARLFRRRIWDREARRTGAARVLTAHTQDDLLETILMRILRGAGPAGLASMSRERGLLLRPLLELGRAEVLAYLDEKGFSFRTDSTNRDIRFLRNRVRHCLIPCLDDYFPSWKISLLALGKTQALVAAFLSAEVRRRLPWEASGGTLSIDAGAFLREPALIREEALFEAADRLAASKRVLPGAVGRTPRRAGVRRFLEALEQGRGAAGDLGPVRAEKQKGGLVVSAAGSGVSCRRGFSLLIKDPGIYTLKGKLTVTAGSVPDSGAVPGDGKSFCAGYPLVFKPCTREGSILKAGHKRSFSDILKEAPRKSMELIAAVDQEGVAAVIGAGKVLLSRDDVPEAAESERPSLYRFFINGPVRQGPDSGGLDV